jgi:hypothetical protein
VTIRPSFSEDTMRDSHQHHVGKVLHTMRWLAICMAEDGRWMRRSVSQVRATIDASNETIAASRESLRLLSYS